MPRNATETKAGILASAIAEFSARGLAGARVDRIADASGVSKRMIYVYFEDKDGLFDAALQQVIGLLIQEVPITEEDLPGYAQRLFDYLVAHPEALRLTSWRQLERPEAGPEVAELYGEKVAAIRAASDPATVRSSTIAPSDLLVLVQGMAGAWLNSPIDLLVADSPDPLGQQRLRQHRDALGEAVRRVTSLKPST